MRGGLLAFACAVLTLLAIPATAGAVRPFETAVVDPFTFSGPQAQLGFDRAADTVRGAGAGVVRLDLVWRDVARTAPTNPADPGDAAYEWQGFDRQVRLATASGLTPIATILHAPHWAQRQPPANLRGWPNWYVDAAKLGLFARAAAARYSGAYEGLPRVRFWEAWNEPNLSIFLNPQYGYASADQRTLDTSTVLSAEIYREMVNAVAASVHGVHADNVVLAGATGPFTGQRPEYGPNGISVGPLRFMRELLCMSGGRDPVPTCDTRVEFDVWTTHPYTSGPPTHHAYGPDDVSLGDLGEMRRLLRAAVRAGHVASSRDVRFWITEFSWDSKPPDDWGVPPRLHARWVSHALYRAWRSGVSLVTWQLLRDVPNGGLPDEAIVQSGLYYRGGTSLQSDAPKPALQAFRFPFVAFGSAGVRVSVWGRTPGGVRADVIVEKKTGDRWRRVGVLRSNAHGIFTGRYRTSVRGYMRARVPGVTAKSRPFSLRRPPALFVCPFGCPPPG